MRAVVRFAHRWFVPRDTVDEILVVGLRTVLLYAMFLFYIWVHPLLAYFLATGR